MVIVKPETLIGWHRKGFRLFWKWKSQAGRPRIPENIRKLIVQMAQENPTWGQARVAVFLLMEVGTRHIVHCSITAHPTAAWTFQQLREAIPSDHSYRFLIHDRDAIFSAEMDQQLKTIEMRVLRTPARAPKANAYCERLVGNMRRIPVGKDRRVKDRKNSADTAL